MTNIDNKESRSCRDFLCATICYRSASIEYNQKNKKMKLQIGLFLMLILLVAMGCQKEDDSIECDQVAVVDNDGFNNADSDNIAIISTEIIDHCLEIKFGASGCDGSTWNLILYDSGDIAESNPPQRNIRLVLENQELCDAYFERAITFDIKTLQVDGNKVILNLQNTGDKILYEY